MLPYVDNRTFKQRLLMVGFNLTFPLRFANIMVTLTQRWVATKLSYNPRESSIIANTKPHNNVATTSPQRANTQRRNNGCSDIVTTLLRRCVFAGVGLIFTLFILHTSDEFSRIHMILEVTSSYGKSCNFDKYESFINVIAKCVNDARFCHSIIFYIKNKCDSKKLNVTETYESFTLVHDR